MEWIKNKLGDESGNSVIEATFIVTTTVVFLFIIMLLGFLFYQKNVLQIIADQTTSSIARTHSYKHKDPITGYIGKNQVADRGFIEAAYWLMQNDDFRSFEEAEAKKLYNTYEKRLRLMAYTGSFEPKVEGKHSDIVLYQDEVIVTAEVKYFIPFTKFMGVNDGNISVKATSRALCADLMGQDTYFRTLNAVVKAASKETGVGELIKHITGTIKNIVNAGGDLARALQNGKV